MKWLCLAITGLFVVSAQQRINTFIPYKDLLEYNQSPQHIVISTIIGGSSHTRWVLEIGNILIQRGHNVTYVTRDDQIHLGQAYPGIQTVSAGGPVYDDALGEKTRNQGFYQVVRVVHQYLNKAYRQDFQYLMNLPHRPDFYICDAFHRACIDAAIRFKVPFATTCTGILYQDISVPYINGLGTTEHGTSEDMTLYERFQHKYMDAVKDFWYLAPERVELDEIRKEFGMAPLGHKRDQGWDRALKLVNSYFGFISPQVLSPLTHVVGPVIADRQRPLSSEERAFLDTHQRIVYVAFGQVIVPSKRDIELFLSSLLDQLEKGHLDGIFWVKFEEAIQSIEAKEDRKVLWEFKTDRSSYLIQSPLLKHDLFQDSNFFRPAWANQFAVLHHPSTVLFLSHGGAESANEATFNGVPILIHPYVGDQRLVGRALHKAGIARVHEKDDCTYELMRQQLNELLVDSDGTVARNLTRMRTLAQIGSKRKVLAADLIEELMYTAQEGVAQHRMDPSKRMSLLKSKDWDLHAAVLLTLFLGFYSVYQFILAKHIHFMHLNAAVSI